MMIIKTGSQPGRENLTERRVGGIYGYPYIWDFPDHKKSSETGNFHDSGPHLMLLLPRSVLKQITSNPYAGGSYVMFPNTEWEHLMIPVTNVLPSFE